MQHNFSRSIGVAEQHLLRHLLYRGAFLQCKNLLVKLTLGKLILVLSISKCVGPVVIASG